MAKRFQFARTQKADGPVEKAPVQKPGNGVGEKRAFPGQFAVSEDDMAQLIDVTLENLDEVLVQQTALFERLTRDAPRVRTEFYAAKDRVEKLGAQIDGELRAGTEKLTENGIKAKTILDPRYVEAKRELAEWGQLLDELSRVQRILEQREKSVSELSRLYMGGYWGVSGIRGNGPARRGGAKDDAAEIRREFEQRRGRRDG